MLSVCAHDNPAKNAVIKNHATFFDGAEVADLVLTNAILIVSDQVELAVTFRIRRDSADKRIATTIWSVAPANVLPVEVVPSNVS
jgi:hypothetical protein